MPLVNYQVCLAAIALIADPRDYIVGNKCYDIHARMYSEDKVMMRICLAKNKAAIKFTALGAVAHVLGAHDLSTDICLKIDEYYKGHAPTYRLNAMDIEAAVDLHHKVALEAIMTLCID